MARAFDRTQARAMASKKPLAPKKRARIAPVSRDFGDPEQFDPALWRWVLVSCKSMAVQDLADGLNCLGFKAYCPLTRTIAYQARKRGTNKRERHVPVFGLYLWVGFRERQPLRGNHGQIARIHGDADEARLVSESVIGEVKGSSARSEMSASVGLRPLRVTAAFKIGQAVRVNGGPFAGFCVGFDGVAAWQASSR